MPIKAGPFTVISAVALAIMAGIWADQLSHPTHDPETVRAQAPVSIRWMPTWLLAPIEKAIADANDPRDRKPKR